MSAQVKRYRAGKVPEYARAPKKDTTEQGPSLISSSAPVLQAPKQIRVVEDRRLARLNQVAGPGAAAEESIEERLKRRIRTVIAPEIISEEPVPPPEPTAPAAGTTGGRRLLIPEIISDPDLSSRQERLAKAKQQQQLKTEQGDANVGELPVSEEEDMSDDGSSEFDSESSEDEWGMTRPSIQPRFISKDKRETIKKAEDLQLEEQRNKEQKDKKIEEQRERTLFQLKEYKAREIEADEMKGVDEVDVDTDDEAEGETEYECWKLRELQRIKRDREQREEAKIEIAQIESRRGMSDAEVIAEKIKLKDGFNKEKGHIRFLQKYYHPGAFFAEEMKDIKTNHDWLQPVGEDRDVDRETLPEVLQVKNFGRASRTKYTHLTKEDTTSKDALWASAVMPERIASSFGGVGSTDRPAKRRKVVQATSQSETSGRRY